MDVATTIQDFNALLASERETSLLTVLRAICRIPATGDIRLLKEEPGKIEPQGAWGGWAF